MMNWLSSRVGKRVYSGDQNAIAHSSRHIFERCSLASVSDWFWRRWKDIDEVKVLFSQGREFPPAFAWSDTGATNSAAPPLLIARSTDPALIDEGKSVRSTHDTFTPRISGAYPPIGLECRPPHGPDNCQWQDTSMLGCRCRCW